MEPLVEQHLRGRLAHLDEIAATGTKGGDGVGRCQIADEGHAGRIHALAAEHRPHGLIRRGRPREGDHRAPDDLRPREPRAGLPADQEEAVAAGYLGGGRQETAAPGAPKRYRDDIRADPWPRRLRASDPRGEGQRGAPSPARLRAPALFRGADLSARSTAHRFRALLLHVLDLRGAAVALSRGSLRRARGAWSGRWPRAPPRTGPDRGRARMRAHGMGGAALEPAGDPLLRAARRSAAPRLAAHASRRTGHTAPERAERIAARVSIKGGNGGTLRTSRLGRRSCDLRPSLPLLANVALVLLARVPAAGGGEVRTVRNR